MKQYTKVLLSTALLFVVIVGVGGFLIYSSQTVEDSRLQGTQSVQIFDRDEQPIANQAQPNISLTTLQPHTKNAFIAIEDKNFYRHKGVAPRRIVGAAIRNVKSGYAKEGASTITQQLVKNTHLNREKTMHRKMREAALAHKIERSYSKDQILEMYLNVIYFGNGLNGIESAAQYYFDISASKLTIRQSATLAAIIKSPARFLNNQEDLDNRANLVINQMFSQGLITETERDEATKETIAFVAKRKIATSASYKSAATQEAARILDLSASDLIAYGYKIYTYYDEPTQSTLVNTSSNYPIKNVSDASADKVLIIANPRGEVSGFHSTNPLLFGSKRNLASVMKPLVVYAPAIELGVVQPATHIIDEPFTSNGFNPRNYDDKYLGAVSVRDCIKQSRNIPAVKTLEYTKINRSTEIAKRLGINLKNENLSLALGNTASGTTFLEALGGYAALSNGGYSVKPSLIKRIENRDGEVVYKRTHNENLRAIGEDTAYIMTDILIDTVKDGTARKLGSLDFQVAAKTGTGEREGTTDNTDAVCVAYTTNAVVLVWVGNTDMKRENDLPKGTTGGGPCAFMARDVLAKLPTTKDFVRPDCVVEIEFDLEDAKFGVLMLTHDGTPKQNRSTELFSKRHAPTRISNNQHRLEPVTIDGKIGDAGVPYIMFDALPTQSYEVYKVIGGKQILQEVVSNQSGQYLYFDKGAKPQTSSEYLVITKIPTNVTEEATSNLIKLITPKNINTDSKTIEKKKPEGGKQWYF